MLVGLSLMRGSEGPSEEVPAEALSSRSCGMCRIMILILWCSRWIADGGARVFLVVGCSFLTNVALPSGCL